MESSYLLEAPPTRPAPGFTVKPFFEAADDNALVGADFWEVIGVGEHLIALAVGSITDMGLGAMTYAAEVRRVLRVAICDPSTPGVNPAQVLERLNQAVSGAERLDRERIGTTYVSLTLAVLDTRTGRATFAVAGMEPPFVVRTALTQAKQGGSTRILEDCCGPVLGAAMDAKYPVQSIKMIRGDLLVLFTDGITGARGAGGKRFGYEALVRTVEEVAPVMRSLAGVAEAVTQRAKTYAGRTWNDDVCLLLALRY